jgi:hypothetical protein
MVLKGRQGRSRFDPELNLKRLARRIKPGKTAETLIYGSISGYTTSSARAG